MTTTVTTATTTIFVSGPRGKTSPVYRRYDRIDEWARYDLDNARFIELIGHDRARDDFERAAVSQRETDRNKKRERKGGREEERREGEKEKERREQKKNKGEKKEKSKKVEGRTAKERERKKGGGGEGYSNRAN